MTTQQTSRREFLRRGAAAAVGLGLAGASAGLRSGSAGAQPAGKAADQGHAAKIVLIGHKPDHPPGTHLYLNECGLLAQCLRQSPGVEAIVSDGWPKDAGVLEGVNAIALYTSPGAELLFKGPHGDEVERLLKAGVGLAAIHWATGIGNKDDAELADRYLNRMGGLFGFGFSGLATTGSRVEHVAPEHPVSRGCADYDLTDEFYLDLKFLPSATPVLKVRAGDKDQTVAWVYERPDSNGGRSYGNTLGHFHENFGIDPFRRALVNAILWTAHYEIPAGGAPCNVTEEDMKLPDAG